MEETSQPDHSRPAPARNPAYRGDAWRRWAVLVHCSSALKLISFGTLSLLVPLLLWYVLGPRDPRFERHARRAFDLQLTLLAPYLLCLLLIRLAPVLLLFLWAPILLATVALDAYLSHRNARAAHAGAEVYQPLPIAILPLR
jgi:uncharacterized Tic20 family protein